MMTHADLRDLVARGPLEHGAEEIDPTTVTDWHRIVLMGGDGGRVPGPRPDAGSTAAGDLAAAISAVLGSGAASGRRAWIVTTGATAALALPSLGDVAVYGTRTDLPLTPLLAGRDASRGEPSVVPYDSAYADLVERLDDSMRIQAATVEGGAVRIALEGDAAAGDVVFAGVAVVRNRLVVADKPPGADATSSWLVAARGAGPSWLVAPRDLVLIGKHLIGALLAHAIRRG